jgi:hypothetical protein
MKNIFQDYYNKPLKKINKNNYQGVEYVAYDEENYPGVDYVAYDKEDNDEALDNYEYEKRMMKLIN